MNKILEENITNLGDINDLYKAIDTSGLLSKSQKNILKYIVSLIYNGELLPLLL